MALQFELTFDSGASFLLTHTIIKLVIFIPNPSFILDFKLKERQDKIETFVNQRQN